MKYWRRRAFVRWESLVRLACGLACLIFGADPILSQTFTGVLTHHNDNARTGQNLNETVLTPQNVNSESFGKLFSYSLDGQVYAQPLYVPNVSIPNQGTHNVVYVVTENDSVFAFDADGLVATPLWQNNLTNPAQGVTTLPCILGRMNSLTCGIYPVYGITSTPVIDPTSGTMYLVARTLENGQSVQRLHTIDITTGAEKFGGPVVIQGAVPGTGEGSSRGIVTFNPLYDIQRAGLLLANGNVYIGWAGSAHGWLMAYNAQTLAQVAVFNTTPNAQYGGVWQSGGGLAADSHGNLYVAVGDATFDADVGGADYGDTLLKLSPTLSVLDYFTPSDQACRKTDDRDLGSGGPMLLPTQNGAAPNELVIAGKGGSPCDYFGFQPATPIYLLNRDSLGQYNSLQDQDLQTIVGSPTGYWSSPAYWEGTNSANVYLAGTNKGSSGDTLDMYELSGGLMSTAPVAETSNSFPIGSTPSISANGDTNGIVWAIERSDGLDVQPGQLPAILYAYDASNVASMLYNSAQVPQRDQGGCGNKFQTPTIANGKVYVGTQNELDVFGLLGNQSGPAVYLSQPCLTFVLQAVGTSSKPKKVTLENSGDSPLSVSSIAVTGTASSDFSQSNNCGNSIPPGGTCAITIVFSPTINAARTAFITITDNSPGAPHNIALTGKTYLAGTLNVSPSTAGFGSVAVGTSSPATPITIMNTGNIPVTINQVSIAGKNTEDFVQTNNCPATLSPNSTCQASLTFAPTAKGVRTASLQITDTAVGSPQVISLSGTGVLPVVGLYPPSLTFPATGVGKKSAPKNVRLTNKGPGTLLIANISITGTNSADFAQTNNCGGSLPLGGSCNIATTFSPTGAGPRTATLTIADNGKNAPQSLALQGIGNASEVSLNPPSVNFPDQQVNTSSPVTPITLTNTGNQTLTISSVVVQGDFSQTNNCGTSLPAAADCTISVVFTPSTTGLRQGQLTIQDNAPDSPQAIPLAGNGVAPSVSVVPASLTFVSQYIFTSSAAQTVTLTNTGTGSLTLSSIVASGDYQQSNNCGANLAPGGSCSVYVTFTPTVLGPDNGSLTFNDNAQSSPQSVPLSGSGVSAIVSFSPASLSFPGQDIFTTSTQQTVTLTNVGTATLTITGINTIGDFQQTSNCGSALPAGNSCSIYFTFAPGKLGQDSGSAILTDNALDSPESIPLIGTGVTSRLSFSPSSVSFSAQAVGTTSPPQNITLTNLGSVALNIAGIVSNNPDFAESDNCLPSVLGGGFCTISLTFTPSQNDPENAPITLTDDAPDSPQVLFASGNGTVGAVSLSPANLSFGSQPVGTTSAPQTVTLTNSGTGVVNIAGITAVNSDYVQNNNCAAVLNPGDFCTVTVTFTPSLAGTDPGTISITDDASANPQQLIVSGSGS